MPPPPRRAAYRQTASRFHGVRHAASYAPGHVKAAVLRHKITNFSGALAQGAPRVLHFEDTKAASVGPETNIGVGSTIEMAGVKDSHGLLHPNVPQRKELL